LPLILCIFIAAFGHFYAADGNPIGDAVIWCWIDSSVAHLRISCFYAVLLIIGVYNIVMFSISIRSLRNLSGLSTPVPGQSINEDIVKSYAKKAVLHIVAFFFVWVWGSINRIQNLVDPSEPVLALYALHAFFTPLQGFLNSTIYFYNNRKRLGADSSAKTSSTKQLVFN
jgi:Slime mold cyclic AMP receptor